jgi:formylmethanofuran dehydrogenase subunit D
VTFTLNTGRTIIQGSYVERKNSAVYCKEASLLHMNPVDMLELDVEEGAHVRVQSSTGDVVMKAVPAASMTRGRVFVCLGPYANHLVGSETRGTGMPDFKTTRVTIEPTGDPLQTVAELMQRCGGVPYED